MNDNGSFLSMQIWYFIKRVASCLSFRYLMLRTRDATSKYPVREIVAWWGLMVRNQALVRFRQWQDVRRGSACLMPLFC